MPTIWRAPNGVSTRPIATTSRFRRTCSEKKPGYRYSNNPLATNVIEIGWRSLVLHSPNEECQARGRRAAFRIVELAGEVVEPLHLRKALVKRRTASDLG